MNMLFASGAPALRLALVDTRHEYYRVYDIYVPIAIGVFGIILLTTLFLVVRNRRRPPEQASKRHNHERLEMSYAVFLCCVVAFLLYLTFSAEHRTDTVANRQRPGLTIDVIASKWEWTFRYPRYGITIRSGTSGLGTFVVPTNTAIRFNLSSVDVIHALWIPQLRYKRDLIHGQTQFQTLTFAEPGTFPGQCAEFCGLRHADMVFRVRAVAPATFRAWAAAGGVGGP